MAAFILGVSPFSVFNLNPRLILLRLFGAHLGKNALEFTVSIFSLLKTISTLLIKCLLGKKKNY